MRADENAGVPGPRRVLMTADAVGGVWRYSLDLASAMRARAIEVVIAVMGPEPNAAQRAAAERAAHLHSRPYRLEWMDDPWDDVERAGEWLLELEQVTQPEVVHLNGYCHASLAWRAPVVVVAHSCVCSWWRGVHGTDAPAGFDRYRLEVSRGLSSASLVIAPTAAMRDALRREYGVMSGVEVIPNALAAGEAGAYASAVAPGASATGPAKAPVVFAAGRLWDEAKNVQALCDVAAGLPWPVYVAGSVAGPDGRCVATGYATHLGVLEPEEIRRWFARAAIYALPARYEPFGLSVLEAAAAGCALVLGDIPSSRENWKDAAAFVPPDNRRALAGALRRLIEDPEECRRRGALAQARAQRFSIDAMADAYLSAYRTALASGVRSRFSNFAGALENRDLTPAWTRSENRDLTPVRTP